jgi:uncharacterized protein (TIGR02001 family)
MSPGGGSPAGKSLKTERKGEVEMKKWSVLLIAVLVFAATTMVPAAQAVEVEGDVYVGVYDKYLWRGINLSGSQPVLQGGVDLSAKGFTVSYWTNVQLSHSSQGDIDTDGDGINDTSVLDGDEATETDIILDYSFDVNDLLSVSIGDIYYTFNVPGSTHELYLGASLNTLLAPSFTVYYDWDAANEADLDGLFYTAAIEHGFELSDSLGLTLGALASYNQKSPFLGDYSDFHNYELSASLDYALSDNLGLSASFLYSDALSDDAEDIGAIEDETVAGLSIAFNF